ncbi:MAG: Protein of unknown function prokaryotic rane [Anaerocolumna sp.]|jgi:uncharacterized transporter YbjL|nr:Protein of unknown function prokaryotic rane [Anaerocolumna sp.]
MLVLLILVVGIVVGIKLFPAKLKKLNERVQVISISLLIFAMGVSLGSKPDFFKELYSLGFESLILTIVPMVLSIILVFYLTERFMKHEK